MRGRSRRKKLSGKVYSLQKRFLAFMLAFAMIFTSVGTDLHVSFAASGNKVDFTIGGANLVDAIRQAIESDNLVTEDSLDFTDGAVEKFDALFFGDGKVYEVYPDIQGDSMEAELRVFVKLPADADDMYMVTGEEEVYFLYVNNGEDTISCSTTITRNENGKEKAKTTKRITVKSYEDKFGDEERNIISKPVEVAPVETAPAETIPEEKPSEAVNEETTAENENVVNPTDENKDEETAAPEESVPEENTGNAEETEAPTEAAVKEEETEITETEAAETEAAETEAPEAEAPAEPEEPAAEAETEAPEPETETPAEEVTASISRHGVPLVAMKEEAAEAVDAAEPAEPEKETAEAAEIPETTEAEKAEEPKEEVSEPETVPETEVETTVEETTEETTAEATEPETEPAGETKPEGPAGQETAEAPAETETEVPAGPGETTAPEENTEVTEPETDPAQPEETTAAIPVTLPAPVPEPVPQPEAPAKPAETADDGDLVGIGYCSTAKVYKSTLNALKALNDIDGYAVTYTFNPENSAKIVDGALAVKEGESLTFGVKNRLGYAVDQVTVNDEVTEPVSATENEDGSQTIWYTVSDVNAELDIFVYMREEERPVTFAMLLDLYADAMVEVTRAKTDGSEIDTVKIPVGEIKDNAPVLAGHEFAYAKVDNTIVKQIAKDEETGKTYVTTPDNELSGIEVDDSKDVVLYYKPQVTKYDVRYKQIVDGTEVTSDLPAQIESAAQVEDGDTLEFAFTLKKGYEVTAVRNGDTPLKADADGVYRVKNVQAKVEITIELKKITEYKLSFHGSNTIFVYNGIPKVSGDYGGPHYYTWETTYAVGNQFSFVLKAHNEWTYNSKVLNKLKLTIDGSDEGSILIPIKSNASETTALKDGITVTVTKTKGGDMPEYAVTVNSTGDIHGAIAVETNFKDQKSSEIWAQELIGVEPLPYYMDNYVSGSGNGDQHSALDPEQYVYASRNAEKNTYIFVKVKPGYSDKIGDITLKVVIDGVEKPEKDYKLETVPSGRSDNGFANARSQGFKYYFVIPKDNGNYKPKDIRIYLTATAVDQIFNVIYDYDNGTNFKKEADYELNQPFAVTDGKEYPEKAGHIFLGWEFDGKVYKPGEIFKIDAATKDLAVYNEATEHYDLTFKAKWEETSKATKVLYTINVFFENESGTFDKKASFTEYGPKDRKAFVIKSSLNNKLDGFATELPANWRTEYVLDHADPADYSVKLKEDGSSSIDIYYCHKKFDYKVIRKYEDATGQIVGNELIKAGQARLGENILKVSGVTDAKGNSVDYNGKNYTWIGIEGEERTITKDGENVVYIYYSLDEKGKTDETDPEIPDLEDGIPDKYQTVFKYKSVDVNTGTVTGTVYEVHTFEENGKYIEASKRPVSPEVKVTVIPADKYAFDYWSIDGKLKDHSVSMNKLKAATYTQDTTFTAYFDKDEIGEPDPDKPDGIPDKYQITFTYKSADDDTGTVTGKTKEVVTVYKITRDKETNEIIEIGEKNPQHPTQPSTVTANIKAGYGFVYWTDNAQKKFETDAALKEALYTENQTFTAYFEIEKDLHYEIHYFYEKAEDDVKEDLAKKVVSDNGKFGEKILTTTVDKESVFEEQHYVLERIEGADNKIGIEPKENVVNIYYTLDVIGKEDPGKSDNVPDKYQITFTYESADDNKGTVTGTTKEVFTVYEIIEDSKTGAVTKKGDPIPQNPTQPSTVKAKDGYKFVYWVNSEQISFKNDDELRTSSYTKSQIFTAHFEKKNDLHYEIHYFYEDANGTVTEDTAAAVVKDNGVFGEKILAGTVAKESDFNGKHYALDRIDGADKLITLVATDNIVNVYYSIDEIGEPDPEKPDGIPDKYQVTFRYISENPSYGTVSGTVKEVVTRPKNADGTYNMTAPVHPKANVTVAGIGNYQFNRWSDGNVNYSAAGEIAKAGFTSDTTFIAYFSYNGGNNGGGGNSGGGGGSSSGGGGGGSHRATISNTTGGPGETTTITPGDVPMAELPETPATTVIDDGDIPMAALPKTGQTAVKAALTMMFSGIFLALTAIGRKKKEQDA